MVSSKLGFILAFTLFFLFVTQVSALVGASVIEGFDVDTEFTSTGISAVDLLIGVANNIGIFFALLGTSSEFFLFGSVLVTAYVVAMIWAILELLRGN